MTGKRSEINSAYHEVTVKLGISDSAMQILYTICDSDDPTSCPLQEIYHRTDIRKQTMAMFVAGELLGNPLSALFVGYDADLQAMTIHAFAIFSISFLFSGISIFGSSFFTALNDGPTSALISFLRTLVCQMATILIFPLLWQLEGIWFSIVAAEAMALGITLLFLYGKRNRYHYL